MSSPLLSLWSRWRSLWKHTSEIVNKSLVWSEGSYKADCSLTTDTNINPATKATCMLYKGTTLSLSVSLTLPDFVMKIDPISNSHCFASQLELTYQQKHEKYTVIYHVVFNTCWFMFLSPKDAWSSYRMSGAGVCYCSSGWPGRGPHRILQPQRDERAQSEYSFQFNLQLSLG